MPLLPPNDDENATAASELLLHVRQESAKRARRVWDGFRDFALKDNVLEVAVGLIIAAAFTTLVTSFVSEILLPPLSLLPFLNRNLDEKFAVLRKGPHYVHSIVAVSAAFAGAGAGAGDGDGLVVHNHTGYNTLKQALDDGAVVLAWGAFLNKLLNFIGMGIVLYAIASVYELASSDSIIKHTVKCKYCRKRISEKAKRCVNCTSWQDGREDRMH